MEFAKNLLNEQRRRMVGSLMAYIEHNVYEHLSPAARVELRGKVLSSVSAYHDVCLDMLKASVQDGTTGNDEALQLIHSMRADLRALRKDA